MKRDARNVIRATCLLVSLISPLHLFHWSTLLQRLPQIPQNILNILDADAQPDEVGADARAGHLVFAELAVGGGGRVDRQALGVADVRQVAEEFQALDEPAASFDPALDAEAEDRARALRQVLRGPRVVGVRGKAGVADPGDLRVRGEELGDALGVGHVPIHAQAQRLDALDRLPAIERRLAAAEVPQDLDPRLQDEGRRAQVGVHQPVVGRVRRGEVGEAAAGPIEIAAVHDDPADGRAVAAQEFGGAVDDDVGAPLERPAQIRRGERVVDHQRDRVLASDRRDLVEREDADVGVAQRLAVDDLGVGLDRPLEVGRVRRIDKRDIDADAREGVAELVVRAAVEPAAGHDVVPRAAEGQDGLRLRRVPAARRQCADAAFEAGDALLQHVGRRIHDAGVDIAELFQGEQIGRVLRALELVAGGLIDRHRAAAGGRVGLLAGVKLAGGEAEGVCVTWLVSP